MIPFQQPAKQPARLILLAVLLTSNVLLCATWPWLRHRPVGGDSSQQPFFLHNVIRNDAYLARFFDAVRNNKKIFFLGTSESVAPYNLAAQLNASAANGPYLVPLSKGGASPIHSALAIARAKREGIRIPPTIFAINPVYFTQSHDVIDDGWISDMIQSPVFLQMNHRDVRSYLSDEVWAAYDDHFALRRLLYPATTQEYLGNLLYLRFHQPDAVSKDEVWLPMPVYRFNGSLPSYDRDQNIWAEKHSVDRFAKNRWRVHSVHESFNLKGLASIVGMLRGEAAPVLLLVLPVNRKFYEYHGMNMSEFDNRYRDIRRTLRDFSQGENVYLVDLYERPKLRFGFRDRMHMDEYGFSQMVDHMANDETYLRFLEAAKNYYDALPADAQTGAQRR